MSTHVSMSQSSFGDNDYDDGEVKKLIVGSTIWNALHEDIWLNCSPSTRQDWENVYLYFCIFIPFSIAGSSIGQGPCTITSIQF